MLQRADETAREREGGDPSPSTKRVKKTRNERKAHGLYLLHILIVKKELKT